MHTGLPAGICATGGAMDRLGKITIAAIVLLVLALAALLAAIAASIPIVFS